MEGRILKVISCGEVFTVKSEKAEGGQLSKRNMVLQELGGKYENQYVVAVLGTLATVQLYQGDLVVATLRFQAREYNGQHFQDITATEMFKIS